jgi:transcriptional regulator with XRE-family HTH domain
MARTEVDASAVGQRVRSARGRLRLNRSIVARNAGLSRRTLAAFERGRRDLSVDEVRSLAGSLGVDVGDLLPLDEMHAGPAPSQIRIEDVLDVPVDIDGLEAIPMTEPLPQLDRVASPVERRKVPRTRIDLDTSFLRVRSELDDVVRAAERLAAMGPDDNPRALIYDLQRALGSLREDGELEAALAELARARVAHHEAAEEHSGTSWESRRVVS